MEKSVQKYKLFYAPATCATAVHVILNAVNADFELVRLENDDNRKPEYLALSPLGQVPVLLEDGVVLRESGAIMIYLLDKYKHALLPQDVEQRRKVMQWLLFFNSTMHQTFGAYFLISKNLKDKAAAEVATTLITKRIQKLWNFVEMEIASDFICGNQVSVADILMAVIANWCQVISPVVTPGTKTLDICRKVKELPYFEKALRVERVKYSIN